MAGKSYDEFVLAKARFGEQEGFEPLWMPDFLFDFQRFMVDWSIRQGRAALFEECGLGKTAQQLVWAENVVRKTNKPVMLATPIAVGQQTVAEAEKFGIDARRTRDGKLDAAKRVWVTNYEQLHKYDPALFGGFVGDESSAIKDFKSERKAIVTEFVKTIPYRLLCTATAAPNDFDELGTSSEALGGLGYRDMITTFFRQEMGDHRTGWGRSRYRFRGHAEDPFWCWVCSWARSLRRPSDLGFDDARFALPPLNESEHVVESATARPGMLFTMAARDMREERAERRRTLRERCEKAAELVGLHNGPSVVWCELNPEGDMLEEMIDGAVQVSGSDGDDAKEEKLTAFSRGEIKCLVTKPKIGAWGLNWQHCRNTVVFPSHSFEQYYQLVRRFYRFGQTQPVNVHLVVCEGERGIMDNLARKKAQADRMFAAIVEHMRDAMRLATKDCFFTKERVPSWL